MPESAGGAGRQRSSVQGARSTGPAGGGGRRGPWGRKRPEGEHGGAESKGRLKCARSRYEEGCAHALRWRVAVSGAPGLGVSGGGVYQSTTAIRSGQDDLLGSPPYSSGGLKEGRGGVGAWGRGAARAGAGGLSHRE
ncbi:hypothetical protein HNY73_022730 [Argiope bruennichi]|uniref:Uncharacterized protein n=1 Tax=Argiope bruennichi TaxID=94029 RepID=A0A8T0E399_ARGBR|nr:hypothetical protein HNY73_022730 [Argiope bruennichi]